MESGITGGYMIPVEFYGKSNSSEGRWVIKTIEQKYHYFWKKSEMQKELIQTN